MVSAEVAFVAKEASEQRTCEVMGRRERGSKGADELGHWRAGALDCCIMARADRVVTIGRRRGLAPRGARRSRAVVAKWFPNRSAFMKAVNGRGRPVLSPGLCVRIEHERACADRGPRSGEISRCCMPPAGGWGAAGRRVSGLCDRATAKVSETIQ